MADIGIKSKG